MSDQSLIRPIPPSQLYDSGSIFIPAPDFEQWLRKTFIDEKATLRNPDHAHLTEARIGVLWTNVEYSRKMRRVAATAELAKPPQSVSAWAKARYEQQLREWFGGRLDFLLTFYAPYCIELDSASFLALCEHELYHCAQVGTWFDDLFVPKFRKDGSPVFGIRGHDVEEFTGVVRRYGAEAAGSDVVAIVEAATQEPLIDRALIAAACGICG